MNRTTKIVVLLSSVVVHSLTGVLMKLSENDEGKFSYSFVEITMLAELCKWLFCLAVVQYKIRRQHQVYESLSWRESIKWSVPAICYAITNNLGYVILEDLQSPVTAAIFSSMQMLMVGILTVCYLKRRLKGIHWAALVLVVSSVASSQLSTCQNCTHWSDYHPGAAALTLLQGGIASFASVYIEKLMKKDLSMSIFQQNTHLYFYGFVINFLAMVVKDGGSGLLKSDFTLQNWNIYATLLVIIFTYLGLLTAAVIKHMSSIAKVFVTNAALVLTTILCGFLFDFRITLPFDLSVLNIGLSIYLYQTTPMEEMHTTNTTATAGSSMVELTQVRRGTTGTARTSYEPVNSEDVVLSDSDVEFDVDA